MRILFCQPIFIPDDDLMKKNLDSIESLKFILENKPDDYVVTFRISGWVKKEEYWDKLIEIVEKQDFNISYERLEHNYGKAYVINKIVEETEEHDYIFTCDSDIIFLKNQNYLIRLVESMERDEKEERGVIAINQKSACAHIIDFLTDKIEYNGIIQKEVLRLNRSNPGGIAGGCLFINMDSWKRINGYKIYGIYAGEDATLFSDMFNTGKKYYMFETLYVVHPYEDKYDYITWKRKVINNREVKTEDDLKIISEKLNNSLWNT